jgi:hypothetical protein
MSNKIQIKRSVANSVVTGLSNGELAFTQASNTLYIGAPDGSSGSIPIGTKLNYGTLTANSVLVANSTSGIDKVIAANLEFQYLIANGTPGTSGYVLFSGGNGSNAYWAGAGGLGVNTDAQYTFTNTITFSNTITFNSTINGTANNALHLNNKSEGDLNVNNATYAYGKFEGDLNVNSAYSATTANNADYAFGKSEGNLNVNSASSALTSNNSTYAFGKSENQLNVNSASSATTANNSSYAFGKSENQLNVNSASSATNANNASYLGGNTASDLNTYASNKAANAYSNAMSDTLSRNGSYTGNNLFGGTNTVISSNLSLTGTVLTNLIPSPNNSLSLGNTTNRWGSLYISGSTIYLGNTTLSANGSQLQVTDLVVTGNAYVANIVGTTTNVSSNLNITAANISATSATLSVRDAVVSGNLTINGTLTTVNTNNLSVRDSMIKIADQNTTSDTVDFGIYGTSGNASYTAYAGLYRDHGASTLTSPVFKLFASNTEPSSIVDNTAPGYTTGTLAAYLNSGAFVANSTAVNITANSTVSSALVANSLTLTTALAATYGGTGQTGYTTGDLLYASSTTALSKLSVPGSAANGQVLQIVNNLPAYGTLDGGTF